MDNKLSLSEEDLALLVAGRLELKDGGRRYYNDFGWLHRVDGPAVTWADGTQEWLLDGERHRIDGPAIIRPTGTNYVYSDDGKVFLELDSKEFWIKGERVEPF